LHGINDSRFQKKAGQIFNVNYQEHLTFTRILFERIADSMKAYFTVTESGDSRVVINTRKQIQILLKSQNPFKY
jgi:hypothetical protein